MDEKKPEWEYPELMPFITSETPVHSVDTEIPIAPSGGHHPGQGQYVIDPDYMEILGLEDPSELIKFHK